MNWIKNWLFKKTCEHEWIMYDEIERINYKTGRVISIIYVQQCEKCGILTKLVVDD